MMFSVFRKHIFNFIIELHKNIRLWSEWQMLYIGMHSESIMKDNHRGYVVGNSVIASEICTDGELFSNIRYNPPCFIDGLNEIISVGSMHLNLVENGKNI